MRNRKVIDLTGQVFNRLTVVKRAEDYIESNGKKRIRWLCKCSCELKSEIIVNSSSLKSGHTQSCGCLQREKASELRKKYNTYDLSGKYGIGYTTKDEEFYFDLEDYDKIKNYSWHKSPHKSSNEYNNGYILSSKNKNYNNVLLHRLIMNPPNDMVIDHINHITYDNRKSNLRICNQSQNCMNSIVRNNNKSGVKGVDWKENRNKWRVRISVNKKTINLGYFENKEDAIRARKEAEEKYFGEYRYKKE